MDPNKVTSKVKLETPITFNPETILTEGIYIQPDVEPEHWLNRHALQMVDDGDFTISNPGIASCSSQSVKSDPKLSSIFEGLRLTNSSEITPILDGETECNEDNWSPLTPYNQLEKFFSNVTDHGEVKKKISQVGNGTKLPINATVWVDYEMWGEGLDEVIYRTTKPFKFQFFQPDIMTWFDLGVSTMEELETAWFLVKPEYGYKKLGIAGLIPPDTTLLFKVLVVRFQTGSVPGILRMPDEDLQSFKYREIIACVKELKERANDYLRRSQPQWRSAYDLYRKAAHFLEKYFVLDAILEKDMFQNIFNLHNNMSLCSIKMEMFDRAIFHCEKALQLPAFAHTNLSKLYYRRAIAEFETGHIDKAQDFLARSKKYTLSSPEIQNLEQRIREKLKLDESVQKDLFRKMMPFQSGDPKE